MTQEEALRHIVNHQSGDANVLKNKLGESLLEEFELVGFLIRGVHTYRTSGSAIQLYNSIYRKPSLVSKFMGGFCHFVLGIK